MKFRIFLIGCCLVACVSPPRSDDSGGAGSGILTNEGGEDPGDAETGDENATTMNGDGDGDPDTGDGDPDTGGSTTEGFKFDLAPFPDGAGNGSNCEAPIHTACDGNSNDPWHALGINCPNELQFTTSYTGEVGQLYVHSGQLGTFNNPPTYPVLEGSKMLILSSGEAMEMTAPGDRFASESMGIYQEDPLPPPLDMNRVHATDDCYDNPMLVGTGDCSNTLQDQWDQGWGAYDYAELRLEGTVPQGATGFAYHLAFFSTEYPDFYQSSFNDMYVAWLESELWTGNVSFDEMGEPISLNAGFLDYKDAPNPYDCPGQCNAPELQGTVMETHAGTKWLVTTAGVMPGEDVTIIWAIWDLSDEILDSVVILDNFSWNCEGGPPVTIPG